MRESLERELKLDVDPSFRLPALEGEPLPDRVFTSLYHDTPVRSLARAGITLRRRVEGSSSLWQLKLPRGGARAELESAGGASGVPADLARLLIVHLRHGPLEKVATLRTHRAGIRALDGSRRVADVTVDAVDVLASGEFTRGFIEVEAELLDGDESDLRRLGRALRAVGARESDGTSKLLRVLPAPLEADAGPTLGEQLRWLLRTQLHVLEASDPGVRLGGEAEDVHRARVATRRGRALIRATGDLLDGRLDPLGGELRWLSSLLGGLRDLDVLLGRLSPQVEALGGDAAGGRELPRSRSRAHGAPGGTRRRARLAAVRTPVARVRRRSRRAPAISTSRAVRRAWPHGRSGGCARRRGASQTSRRTTNCTSFAARRSVPATRPSSPRSAARRGGRRYLDALQELQDVVGEHQDLVVAERHLRDLVRPSSDAAAVRLIVHGRVRRLELGLDALR